MFDESQVLDELDAALAGAVAVQWSPGSAQQGVFTSLLSKKHRQRVQHWKEVELKAGTLTPLRQRVRSLGLVRALTQQSLIQVAPAASDEEDPPPPTRNSKVRLAIAHPHTNPPTH